MATKAEATGALPAVPTGISLADPEERQKYTESVQKVLSALENRSQVPWFKMAAAFADPGRTGTFGEAFGKAMGAFGQHQEEDRARALPIAQMRAQLAGQQYEMSKEEKALNAFAKALGTTPQNLQQGMAGAQYNPAMMQRLNAAMPMFFGSPKVMDMAKAMFGQFNDISKVILEERKLGMSEAELIAKYGAEIRPLLSGGAPTGQQPPAGTAPPPAGQPSPTAAPQGGRAPAGGTSQRDPNLVYDERGNVIDVRAQEDPEAPTVIQGQTVTRPERPEAGERPAPEPTIRTATEAMPAPIIEETRIRFPDGRVLERGASSLEAWNKLKQSEMEAFSRQREEQIKFERERISKAAEQRDATVETKVKELGTINPDDILRTQGLLQSFSELMKDPQMAGAVGLMMKQGAGPAMYALAKDGVRVGNFGLSVDVYNGVVKTLPKEAQEKLRMAEMLLSELFIQKAREAKSAFGPQISNFDILMQKERMASTRDTPKIISNWLAQEQTVADQKLEMANAYMSFLDSAAGTNRKPSQFFNSPEYKAISKKYGQIYKDLATISYGAPK